MALKRPYQNLSTFSMSSMTDVIFLLLIFFMVTSTLIFPSAIDVNLPQSGEQMSTKPVTEVYITADSLLYIVPDRHDSIPENCIPRQVSVEELSATLATLQQADSLRAVALYADKSVGYGKVVDVLDIAASNNIKMVLATKASQTASGLVDVPSAPSATTGN